jgi:hypothetical protein
MADIMDSTMEPEDLEEEQEDVFGELCSASRWKSKL